MVLFPYLGILGGASPALRDFRGGPVQNQLQGVFFHWASPKKTKSKIVLEYPDWASPDPPKLVKVYGLGLP